MNKDIIKFRHQYYKLSQTVFTTIRGKTQFKRLKVGEVKTVETPAETFQATIIRLEVKKVCDMSEEFLQADAEYPGCKIRQRLDFVKLLNSFRAPAWTQVTLDSELTIIYLKRL